MDVMEGYRPNRWAKFRVPSANLLIGNGNNLNYSVQRGDNSKENPDLAANTQPEINLIRASDYQIMSLERNNKVGKYARIQNETHSSSSISPNSEPIEKPEKLVISSRKLNWYLVDIYV